MIHEVCLGVGIVINGLQVALTHLSPAMWSHLTKFWLSTPPPTTTPWCEEYSWLTTLSLITYISSR